MTGDGDWEAELRRAAAHDRRAARLERVPVPVWRALRFVLICGAVFTGVAAFSAIIGATFGGTGAVWFLYGAVFAAASYVLTRAADAGDWWDARFTTDPGAR